MQQRKFIDLVFAALPLALTPAVVLVLADGWLDFGGGEKDIALAVLYALWSIIFGLSSIALIFKGVTLRYWIATSAIIATAGLLVIGLITYLGGWLGV